MFKKTSSRLLKKKIHSFLYYKEKSTKILGTLILKNFCVSFFSFKKEKKSLKNRPYDFFQNFDVVNSYLEV
jgi:hypothetical protein